MGLPMARPRYLFLASVAATLVSFVAAGGGESKGDLDCGKAQTWKLAAGEEKRCCTEWLKNDVDKFEYKATPSGSWGPGSITFSVEEYSIWEDIANPAKVSAAKCQLDGSAQTCTGDAYVLPGSSGKCSAVVDISAKGHEDICVVAKCDVGAKCEDHQVEIKFHHSEDSGDDDDDNDADDIDWYGDDWYDAGGEDFGDFKASCSASPCAPPRETPNSTRANAARSPRRTKIGGAALVVRTTAAPHQRTTAASTTKAPSPASSSPSSWPSLGV